jgi:formylglycine-generating enzyme required for sulfatase activity
VNVTWEEASEFCTWLTAKEHQQGVLAANMAYQLPTDLEWSAGVGLIGEIGETPERRDMKERDVYPWGNVWPPPKKTGNFTGMETKSQVAIPDYDDGFLYTAPVGSFQANQFGLFDMSGNVWEWTSDRWSATSKSHVLRGASWYNGALKLSHLSSCRVHEGPHGTADSYGFRIVIAMTKPPGPAQSKSGH